MIYEVETETIITKKMILTYSIEAETKEQARAIAKGGDIFQNYPCINEEELSVDVKELFLSVREEG